MLTYLRASLRKVCLSSAFESLTGIVDSSVNNTLGCLQETHLSFRHESSVPVRRDSILGGGSKLRLLFHNTIAP